MLRKISHSTRWKILSATLELMESTQGADGVTMRRIAKSVGVTPMAIYKHFPDREALLLAATAAEYLRIASYFERANAKLNISGLRGMHGYLDYAFDHPQLFKYMFSSQRTDAFVFPQDLKKNKSPTFNILQTVVSQLIDHSVFKKDDAGETALSIWAHAHGLITLYLCGRINMPRASFRKLYMRSLDRLLNGLRSRADNER
ncbi:MAG TPA: TetR/AcrR family transcriptional regulator [Gammaproteobacteria bacterium]|nr:TetR/AcrR family transcriptional regulator [Gammaproteobacteria bacterium]